MIIEYKMIIVIVVIIVVIALILTFVLLNKKTKPKPNTSIEVTFINNSDNTVYISPKYNDDNDMRVKVDSGQSNIYILDKLFNNLYVRKEDNINKVIKIYNIPTTTDKKITITFKGKLLKFENSSLDSKYLFIGTNSDSTKSNPVPYGATYTMYNDDEDTVYVFKNNDANSIPIKSYKISDYPDGKIRYSNFENPLTK